LTEGEQAVPHRPRVERETQGKLANRRGDGRPWSSTLHATRGPGTRQAGFLFLGLFPNSTASSISELVLQWR
jgi:hypothetical protein